MGSGEALAAQPEPWQLGFQPRRLAGDGADRIRCTICCCGSSSLISIFVLALLVYVCFRFRASRNASPSRRTHNTLLEIAWTACRC